MWKAWCKKSYCCSQLERHLNQWWYSKGNGWIVKCNFPSFIAGSFYAYHENAWMDEACMLQWVNDILKPHVETAPLGVIPVLLFDSYMCHMMGSIVEAINNLEVQVEHIPGGCTALYQPVYVGFNKPFKGRMCKVWEESGINEETSEMNTIHQQDVACWVSEADWDVPLNVISDSWRHASYNWFD